MTHYVQAADAATTPATLICVFVQFVIVAGGYAAMKAITRRHDA